MVVRDQNQPKAASFCNETLSSLYSPPAPLQKKDNPLLEKHVIRQALFTDLALRRAQKREIELASCRARKQLPKD